MSQYVSYCIKQPRAKFLCRRYVSEVSSRRIWINLMQIARQESTADLRARAYIPPVALPMRHCITTSPSSHACRGRRRRRLCTDKQDYFNRLHYIIIRGTICRCANNARQLSDLDLFCSFCERRYEKISIEMNILENL